MNTIYLLTPYGYQYKGQVKWVRIAGVILNSQQVYELFDELSKDPSFIGLIYIPDQKILVTYYLPNLQIQIIAIVGLIALVGGIIIEYMLNNQSSSGTGYFDINNPPGLPNLSLYQLFEIGVLALIGGFIVWLGTETYISIKKGEHPKNPYTPIIETTQQLYPYAKETAKGVYSATKETAQGIYNSIQ